MLQNVNKHWRAHLEMLLEETVQSNCSSSGVHRGSIGGPSGVHRGSVGDLLGLSGVWGGCWGPSEVHWELVSQKSVRSQSGVHQESVRSLSGVCEKPFKVMLVTKFGELI